MYDISSCVRPPDSHKQLSNPFLPYHSQVASPVILFRQSMQRPSADLHNIQPLLQANHASFDGSLLTEQKKIGCPIFSWLFIVW